VAASNLALLLVTYRSDKDSLDRAKVLIAPFEGSKIPAYEDAVGWVKFKVGLYQQALPLLRAAVQEAPDSVLTRYHLGMAQLQTGDRKEARRNIELAVGSGRPFLGLQDAKDTLSELNHDG
jgi:cellulose synthase operon protein C